MKAKWITALMLAMFSGALATAASAGGMGNSGIKGWETNFNKLDENNDGRISLQEAEAKPDLAQSFKRFDDNHNGKLDKGEFSRFETMDREQLKPW